MVVGWVIPPLEMWGAPVECHEVAVAAELRGRGPVDGGGGKLLKRSACWPMCGGLADWWSDDGR